MSVCEIYCIIFCILLCPDRSGYYWRYRWVPNMAWVADNLFPNADHDLVPVWAEEHHAVWTQCPEAQLLPSLWSISIGLVYLPTHNSTYCTTSVSSLEVQTASWYVSLLHLFSIVWANVPLSDHIWRMRAKWIFIKNTGINKDKK